MTFDAETQDYLDTLAARGGTKPPATLSEVWSANWTAAGLTTVGGMGAPRAQALDELRAAYRGAVGVDPYEEARRAGVPIDDGDDEQKAATIAMLAKGLPEAAQRQLAPHLDINVKSQGIAAKIERDAADVGDRTWGLSANATAWAAGLARTMVDPMTLAVTTGVALATPETAGLAPFLAREAFINAAATAGTQPIVNAERARLGLEPAPLLQSIGESAVAGAALGGLFRGAGVVARRMFGRTAESAPPPGANLSPTSPETAVNLPPAAREAAGTLDPADFDVAAHHLENRAVEDALAIRPDAAGVSEHQQAIDAATAAIERGESAAGPLAAPTPDAAALADAIDARAAELSPRVFATARELDQRIASARANVEAIASQPEPDALLAGRIAQIEGDLSEITGKRRSSPRAKELRAELEGLQAQREELLAQQRAINEEQLATLRRSIVDMQSERALLGPKIRAVRAHAAKQMGGETGDALAVAAARDERAAMAGAPREEAPAPRVEPVAPEAPTVSGEAPRPAAPAPAAPAPVPPRPLSDYPVPQARAEPLANLPRTSPEAAAPTPATEVGIPRSVGKPADAPLPSAPETLPALRAQADRAIAEAGDAPFHFTDEATGETRLMRPSELLAEIDEDTAAAREFSACLAGDYGDPSE